MTVNGLLVPALILVQLEEYGRARRILLCERARPRPSARMGIIIIDDVHEELGRMKDAWVHLHFLRHF